ncbi:MAG: transposase [Burkholderiaceae bacterium]
MARLNRLVVAGQAHHVGLHAVFGADAFAGADDAPLFVEALRRSSVEHRVAIHAYVLLKHEVQLIATPVSDDGLGPMMQALARFYVGAFNRRHGRSGALWQSRFRAAPVGGASELLCCMRFVEQAPRRAGWAGLVAEFPWSSAAHHAGMRADALLAGVPPGSAYWQLGNTPFEREAAYRSLLEEPLLQCEVDRVAATTLRGWAMGSGEFIASLAAEAPRRPESRPRGRPRKQN